jgi:solute carrier family 10 (sodium/bile acid cotransporter), member 7
MRAFLNKRWFLLLLVGAVGLSVLAPAWVRPCVGWFDPQLGVVLSLFLTAWSLESRSLLAASLRPLPALWAVAISYGALPALCWALGGLLPDPELRLGLMICASVPCTLASAPVWTRLAGGNDAVALLVVLLTTGTSWLVTTAWLTAATGTGVSLDAADMMRGLVLTLVVPVVLGQAGRSPPRLARTAERWKVATGVAVRLLVLAIIVKATVGVGERLTGRTASLPLGLLVLTAGLCLSVHSAALVGGLASSRGLGFDRPSRIAVGFACSQKTLPVGLYLFDRYFKDDYPLAVVPLLFYHVGQFVVDTFVADWLTGRPVAVPDEQAA